MDAEARETISRLEKEIVRLRDIEEVRELVHKFIWGVDTNDMASLRALFVENPVIDMTGMGLPRFEGPEGLRQCFADGVHPSHTIHLHGNHLIEIDGDRATGKWASINYSPLKGTPVTSGNAVEDEYVRTANGWRFASRRFWYLAPRSIPRDDDEHIFGEDLQFRQQHGGSLANPTGPAHGES